MANERRFDKFRAKLPDLEIAAEDRLNDATALFNSHRYASAIAMGLYAVEISLKVAICKILDLDALPQPFEIHELDGLLILAGLSKRLNSSTNTEVRANWDQVTGNSSQYNLNDLRYLPAANSTDAQASEFLRCINDESTGVLPWIKSQSPVRD
jgi:hypothetical protein